MKLWVVWYRNLWERAEILDSIWTDKKKAQERKDNIDNFSPDPDISFDQYSTPWIAQVNADCELGLNLANKRTNMMNK